MLLHGEDSMNIAKISRVALWGGIAIFLLRVLCLGTGRALNTNAGTPFAPTTEALIAGYIGLFSIVAGIAMCIVGAALKAIKKTPSTS